MEADHRRNTVELAGISIQAFDSLDQLAAHIIPQKGIVLSGSAIAINPEKIMRVRRDLATRKLIEKANIRYADGAGVVWAMRRKGVNGARIAGADLWEVLMQRAADCNIPVFLLGAEPDVNQRTADQLRRTCAAIEIRSNLHGYASDEELEDFRTELAATGSALVSVAMGSPKQERVIESLREYCPDAFFMGVGGTFDCYVDGTIRAPKAWQNANLEWLHRLIRQPSRIRRQWKLLPYAALILLGRI